MPTLDIIIPFYNEELGVRPFVEQLVGSLGRRQDFDCRFIFIDDGSSDKTAVILSDMAASDMRIHVISLWGNHGHQKALVAGLDHADADYVLMMDGDGQHPVEAALDMINIMLSNNVDVVQALRRGVQEGTLKNITSRMFYWSVNAVMSDACLHQGASDFRVLSRDAVQLIRSYPDRYRNIRVLLASLCLKTQYTYYDLAPRNAGVSKYTLQQMVTLALNGWFAFSSSPLKICLVMMGITGAVGVFYLVYSLFVYIMGHTVPGWTSLIAFISLLFCGLFAVLAILAEYVSRIYEDVRGHPIYRLRKPIGKPHAQKNKLMSDADKL
jgi:dolichol-phosphate mannosyltransferase